MTLATLRKEVRKLPDQIGLDLELDPIEDVDTSTWTDEELAHYSTLDLTESLDFIEAKTGHRPRIYRDNPVTWVEFRLLRVYATE